MDSQKSIQDIIHGLINGVIPEKSFNTSALFEKYEPDFNLLEPGNGFKFCVPEDVGKKEIKFGVKELDVLWLIGYAGWKSIETYSPLVELVFRRKCSVEEVVIDDKKLEEYEMGYKLRIANAQSIISVDQLDERYWPHDLVRRTDDRQALSYQDKAVFDLICIALAFMFLHELRHLMYEVDKNRPENCKDEEQLCDQWAKKYLLDDILKYSSQSGSDYEKVKNKRMMGIALASLILFEVTGEEYRQGAKCYPQIGIRIKKLIGDCNLDDNSTFYFFASCILIGMLRKIHKRVDIIPLTPSELLSQLIDLLVIPELGS